MAGTNARGAPITNDHASCPEQGEPAWAWTWPILIHFPPFSIIACNEGWADLRLLQEHRNASAVSGFMNWSSEPATESQLSRLRQLGYAADCPLTKGEAAYLIKILEEQGSGLQGRELHLAKHVAYALRLAIEHTRRARAEAATEQIERLEHSLALAIARRREFWTDTCRDPAQMQARSAPVMDLYMKYGCRFVPPTHEQVQVVLEALDAASPVWDRDNSELFYQTLQLNFPELVRHV
jgi:hypothetical protein